MMKSAPALCTTRRSRRIITGKRRCGHTRPGDDQLPVARRSTFWTINENKSHFSN